jgi:type IV pilus assembly protein PilW
MCRTTLKQARGFSIIELMISVALSSMIVLAIVTLFASNSQTMRVQTALNDVNESGRYALVRMARDVRMLGFRAGGYAVPNNLNNALLATAGQSDTLSVSYEAPFDCNRTAVGPSGVVTNTYLVMGDNLACNGQVLASDIEEMRVMLGEDLDGDGVPNRFVPADTPGLQIEQVVSVRIDLLARSNTQRVVAGQSVLYHQWNRELDNTGRMRQEYSVTVALRNRI